MTKSTQASVEEVLNLEDASEGEMNVSTFLAKHRFAGTNMSKLPIDIEEDIRELSAEQAVELYNRVHPEGKRLCGVSDSARIAQLLGETNLAPTTIKKELEMIKASEVKTAKTGELVSAYNELTGKSIKKFATRAAGEKAVTKLLSTNTEGNEMAKTKATKTNGKAKRTRAPRTTKVQLTVGNGQGRLNPDSLRTKLVDYMKANYGQKAVEIAQLSEELKYDVRPVVSKLAVMNWVKMS